VIRVVTLNTRHGTDRNGHDTLEAQAALIRAHLADNDPSLVLLQECDRGMSRSAEIDQPRRFSELLGLPVTVFGSNLRRGTGQYGTAIVTDLDILEAAHLLLEGGAAERITHIDGTHHNPEQRGLLTVRLPGDLLVINVHASIYPTERRQMREDLQRIAAHHTGPLLIAGDFNSADPGEQLSVGGLLDAATDDRATFPSDRPAARIDRILTRGLRVRGYVNVSTTLSDHHLLAADVQM
jgi:endonuclease/exonuclease/phosphatase family metal-dependent hydrolase